MSKDYYQTLGISKTASADEIKQAYRKLAREHHPDMVQGSNKDAAEKRFKEINEAYQVLSDPQKRKSYDQFGSAGPTGNGFGAGFGQDAGGFNQGQWGPFSYSYSTAGGEGGQNPFGAGADFDPFDVFESFFGSRGFGGSSRQPRHGKHLNYEMVIDFVDAVKGAEREVKVESGKVTIKIPQGAQDGTELRFAGKGMAGPNGLPNGDLFITLRLNNPREFQLSGENVLVAKEISFADAVLGAEVEIPIIDPQSSTGTGHTKLKIPAGTQYGTRFAVRGKGMPKIGGRGFGDVYVQVFVEVPKKVSKKQKELLESFRREN